MERNKYNIVIVGAGNVAHHMGLNLLKAHYNVVQVYSRTYAAAQQLAQLLNCPATSDEKEVIDDADLYLFAVKDDSLSPLLERINLTDKVMVHTAGSVNQNIFAPYTQQYGVIYPLQTLSKKRDTDFTKVPLLVEASDEATAKIITAIASELSSIVHETDGAQRQVLHVAAVFACNFVNHMYRLAFDIVSDRGVSFELLKPLIEETARKISTLTPAEAQTGPAVRFDRNIIEKHTEFLKNNEKLTEIYALLTANIYDYYKNNH
jgi:predicted short-subunit dehydrogenase-like oxidoreductase (DUF2520 family)